MKNIFFILTITLLSSSVFAQGKVAEDSIYVSGNCTMCKMRIEKALDLNGIKMANWNVATKKLFIAYRSDKITIEEIHKAIAAVGHDTDLVRADDEVYADLPFCCLHRDHDPHGSGNNDHHDKGH